MEKNWINPEIFNLLDKKSPDFLINSNKDSVDYLKKYIDKSIVKNYIIIDDDSDMLYNQREHFIHTSFMSGLTNELTDKAISILNKTLIELYY